MNDFIKQLPDLNNLNRGVNKRWIYKNRLDESLAHDYLQKINFSIQDINNLIERSNQIADRTDLIALVVMVDWIIDSINQYKKCLIKPLINDFCPSQQDLLDRSDSFLKAIRSFLVAHPLTTNRHKAFGLDGNFICMDIRFSIPPYPKDSIAMHRLCMGGLVQFINASPKDVYLRVYSKEKDPRFCEYIVLNVSEIFQVANSFINHLYEVNRFLNRSRKKDYVAK